MPSTLQRRVSNRPTGAHPGRTPAVRHLGDAPSPPPAVLSDPHCSRVFASDGAAPWRHIALAILRAMPPRICARPRINGTAGRFASAQTARERDWGHTESIFGDTRALPEIERRLASALSRISNVIRVRHLPSLFSTTKSCSWTPLISLSRRCRSGSYCSPESHTTIGPPRSSSTASRQTKPLRNTFSAAPSTSCINSTSVSSTISISCRSAALMLSGWTVLSPNLIQPDRVILRSYSKIIIIALSFYFKRFRR